MTDRDALYRAILAHPDDDTPRLVYADWLEENGRAEEAEFIRVECRLEAGHPDDPDHVELCDRREELRLWLAAHVTGPEVKLRARLRVEGSADWWNVTHRGFPRFLEYEGLPVSPPTSLKAIRALAAALDKAFERVPTRWLSVWSITVAELAELLRHAAVAGLNHLTIHVNPAHEPQDEACRLIADCPHLAKLRGLYLRFPVDDAGAAALAGSKNLLGLRKLALDRVALCSPVGVRALGTAGWFQSLHGLELSELEETSFEELCRVAPLPNLHTLELREAGFATASWRVFARSKSFPRLSRLIHSGEMFSGQMEALAETEHLRLAVLDLAGSSIGNDGARTLAAAPWIDSLRWLGLSYNLITASGFTAIAGCRKFIALRHLDLSNNSPGARGLRELASNPALRGLTSLLLNGTFEDSRGLNSVQFQQFFNDLDMPNLRRLELTRRPLGARAARALTASKYSSLTRLNLDQCKLTDAAMAALVTAPALQNLIEFDAAQNGLKSGVEALTNRKVMPRLAAANFSSNRIGRDLARKLKRRPGVYA